MDHKDLPPQKPISTAPGVKDLLGKAVDTSAKIVRHPAASEQQSLNDSGESKLPQVLLDKLWLKMSEMYGHRWTSSFGESADQDHSWAKILGGLTGRQLAAGLQQLIERAAEFDWPPPANVFRAMCLHVQGLPPIDQAWTEALMGKYSHEAVKVAAEATGTFDLRSAKHSDRSLYQRFERNYAIVQRRAQNAQPLDGKIAQGIEHDSGMKAQLARSHQEARDLIAAQGLPTDPQQARKLLLAKLGIRRPA
ncbi:hypothetical protein NJF44_01220 [Pseudomonas guariconensis]|uniref:hypothetical protein n=1 Tax=Pseudomonas TaxID=286 RepID=UPI00209811E7|nr:MULTISPECIES: hypothetical protein [Pseudomonas]MCO7513736.1 hypothetical protein [Pseudomonas putida]MCO7603863.1 hypothetical protein [Pseudomonas guariconensis]